MFICREAGWDPIQGGLGMKPEDVIGRFWIWQIVTSMFLHDPYTPFHLLMNMLILWLFGRHVEQRLGSRTYLRFYFLAGLAAGLAYVVFGFLRMRGTPAVGASGAIFGILVYFTMLNPNLVVNLFFILPMRMIWVTTLFVGLDLYYFVFNPGSSGVANSAHLGGALFGFLYYRYGHRVDRFFTKLEVKASVKADRKKDDDLDRLQAEVDDLLDIIREKGMDGLTARQKKFLHEASLKLGKERP
jgi:membrane associated rhomboid family serine protease